MTTPLTWVLGSGGLLGSNVARAARESGRVWEPQQRVPWTHVDARQVLSRQVMAFSEVLGSREPWEIAWCAGSGITTSAPKGLAEENATFAFFLREVSRRLAPAQLTAGGLFVASSAGGVFAGSAEPPFTEQSATRPISPYGEAKLELEDSASQWGSSHGVPVLVGRIANLYGPGQDLSKPQGLISQLCRAHLKREPIRIYVPLDTVRDYVYAADCGPMIADALRRLRLVTAMDGPVTHVKIFASQEGVTIAALLGHLRRLFKRPLHVVLPTSHSARYQARDLRLRSTVWPDLDRRAKTPLPAGVRATVDHISKGLRSGPL